MIRDFYRWIWEDLGLEEPHPLRALLYVGAAVILALVLWALAVLAVLA